MTGELGGAGADLVGLGQAWGPGAKEVCTCDVAERAELGAAQRGVGADEGALAGDGCARVLRIDIESNLVVGEMLAELDSAWAHRVGDQGAGARGKGDGRHRVIV